MRLRPHISARTPARGGLALLAVLALGAGLFASGAAGLVAVYVNNLSSKAQYKELKRASGGEKGCERSYRKKAKAMRVSVRGQRLCAYMPPVTGDGPRPNHDFAVDGKVLKSTPKAFRKPAYLAILVRVGGGNSYELQVRPKSKRFRLVRNPDGAAFPASGQNRKAIAGIGKRNKLRIRAKGATVTAWVNGKRLANVTDPDAADFKGAKVAFGLGSRRAGDRGPVAAFDRIRLRVPNP